MPEFTVIDGGGPEGRDRILAEQDFRDALREGTANMLRVNRGAGKSYGLLKTSDRRRGGGCQSSGCSWAATDRYS